MGQCCKSATGRQQPVLGEPLNAQRSSSSARADTRQRALEAAERRQQHAALPQMGKGGFTRKTPKPIDDVDPKAHQVSLNEQGYAEIAALRSNASMKVFITRVASDMDLEVLDQEKFEGWVPYWSGQLASKKYATLVYELGVMSLQADHWIQRRGALGAAELPAAPYEASTEGHSTSEAERPHHEDVQAFGSSVKSFTPPCTHSFDITVA